jgi:hypothetical protein
LNQVRLKKKNISGKKVRGACTIILARRVNQVKTV